MAGPVFRRVGNVAQSASAATLTPAKPAVDVAGGLLVCVVSSKNNATHVTATAGWTKLGATVNSGASFCASIFTAAEGSANPVITWTGAAACAAQIIYDSDPANGVDTTIGASGSAAGATATHTSASTVTTRADSLVRYIDVAAANTALATPSGWTEDADTAVATAAGRIVFGNKPVATSGSGSGAISVTGANAAWVQWQIEIRGSAPGPLDFSKLELASWFSPPRNDLSASKLELASWFAPLQNELSSSKVELGSWLIPNDNQNRYSKIELGAWLTAVPVARRRPRLLSVNL